MISFILISDACQYFAHYVYTICINTSKQCLHAINQNIHSRLLLLLLLI